MCPLFSMLKSCLLILKFITVCLIVTLLLSKYGADWKFFEFASVVLSFYKEIFAFVFKNITALLFRSRLHMHKGHFVSLFCVSVQLVSLRKFR